MPFAPATQFTAAEAVTVALTLVLALIVGMMGYLAWKRSRVSPEERERHRRAALVSHGKMGDATVLEIHDDLVLYSYGVRGVGYTAAQDLTALRSYLPPDLTAAIGPVLVRYDAQNPANSIILAEDWSGLRAHSGARKSVLG